MAQEQAGQSVDKIVMTIEGEEIQVLTPFQAAYRTNYEPSYIRQLCDEGKLIATKKFGRWWLHLDARGNIITKGVTF